MLHYHSNKEKYMELYQCQCDLIGTKTVLCYHDNKATDVVKTILFLTECYNTNNLRPISIKSGTFFCLTPAEIKY